MTFRPFAASMQETVRRANVVYDLNSFQTGSPHVPPFLSSGILGGCFDIHGFMSRPNTGIPEGRTVLGYIGHFHRRDVGQHIQFPLAIIRGKFADGTALNLVDCQTYRQELDLLTGTLTTAYGLYGSTCITAFASIVSPNLFVTRVERMPDHSGRDLIVEIECETSVCQNNDVSDASKVLPVGITFVPQSDRVVVRSRTNTTDTNWIVSCPGAIFDIQETRIVIRLQAAESVVKIWVEHPGGAAEAVLGESFAALHQAHSSEWRRFWETSWVSLPDEIAHNVWTRTKYYVGSNFPVIPAKAMCPEGVLSNTFPFPFPQDVYYVAENVPRLGHFERAVAALQWWLDVLPDVRKYTQRLMGVSGAFYPWTPPFKDWDRFEVSEVVSPDSYELHNSAYVVAMVWHAYLLSQDVEFLQRFFPVIEGVFEFYTNLSTKSAAGTYDIYHDHARGQDEASSTEGHLKNLLCASFSAEYSARAYVEASGITGLGVSKLLDRARDIVRSGYTRQTLLRPEGIYRTYDGDQRPLGKQKHPVQLNPITYLPMRDLDEPAIKAWNHRYDLTENAKRPHTAGWTLGQFILASVRMRAPKEALKDLRAVQPCRSADPRWIQFYESSFQEGWHLQKAYYFTMSGLYLQAFTDTLVQDWRGYVDLFACLLPGWEEKSLSFHGLRARGGSSLSGWWERGTFEVVVTPGKAHRIALRVSRPGVTVKARGQAEGPVAFSGDETVEFTFQLGIPIVLTVGNGQAIN